MGMSERSQPICLGSSSSLAAMAGGQGRDLAPWPTTLTLRDVFCLSSEYVRKGECKLEDSSELKTGKRFEPGARRTTEITLITRDPFESTSAGGGLHELFRKSQGGNEYKKGVLQRMQPNHEPDDDHVQLMRRASASMLVAGRAQAVKSKQV